MSKISELRKLIDQLNTWSYHYHTLDNPIVSDAKYDKYYDELVRLEEETGIILSDSPTQKIGDTLLSNFEKHTHINRLYSLDKAQNFQSLIDFDNRVKTTLNLKEIEYVVELKFDGLTISLTYRNKALQVAATRGTGQIGENITEQVKRIQSIPLSINNKDTFEIIGEAYMPFSSFKKYNIDHPDNSLKNPRNAAAGAIRNLDTSELRKKNIKAYFYNISTYPDKLFKSDQDIKDFLSTNGFEVNTNYFICKNIEEVILKAQEITKLRSELDFMIDGVVIKVNNLEYREKLGYTNKFPRWAIAYKFEAEERYTKLIGVQWNVGRTSKVTPSAILEPVEIDGVTIGRATLNNYGFIESKDIRINSEVLLRRSNDVIPEILKADNTFNETYKIEKPSYCPACNSKLEEIGAHLFCTNTLSCQPQLVAKLTHFVSKNAMDIVGLSEKTIEKLVEIHDINNAADLYKLNEEDLGKLEGFKEKRINNTLESIEKSKNVDFNHFINALGIPNVGEKTAYDLAEHFENLEELINANIDYLSLLDDIGPKTAESIYSFFKNQAVLDVLDSLFKLGVKINFRDKNKSLHLEGKTFVITGSFNEYKRSELEELIKSKGGKVSNSVSKNTDYLLLGEKPGSKHNKAIELNIKIVEENEIEKIINKD